MWIDSQSGNAYSSGSSQLPILQDSSKFNSSIMNRLYFQDCDGMSHYRLVYESAGAYTVDARSGQIIQSNGQQYVQYGGTQPMYQANNYTQAEQLYLINSKYVTTPNQQVSQYTYGAEPPEKWVKIFEKVDGATDNGQRAGRH